MPSALYMSTVNRGRTGSVRAEAEESTSKRILTDTHQGAHDRRASHDGGGGGEIRVDEVVLAREEHEDHADAEGDGGEKADAPVDRGGDASPGEDDQADPCNLSNSIHGKQFCHSRHKHSPDACGRETRLGRHVALLSQPLDVGRVADKDHVCQSDVAADRCAHE